MRKYLYHYTTIQNLALILKNRTLRLMPLNLMDDLQEAKSKDVQNFGQFVYVSSWTDKEEEVIPMWKMYTKPECGVRIGMLENPFQIIDKNTNEFRDPMLNEYEISKKNWEELVPENVIDMEDEYSETSVPILLLDESLQSRKENKSKEIFPIYRIEEMKQSDCFLSGIELNQQLEKVKYTRNIKDLEPKILSLDKDGKTLKILLGKIGSIKNEYWSFQKEWRYVIRALPFSIFRYYENPNKEMRRFIDNISAGTAKQTLPHIDLHLSNYALETMEIILAPDMPEANKILVECLIEKYNPEMRSSIKESSLKGLIK